MQIATGTNTIQQQVIKLLGWTEQQYSNYVFETGFAYLNHYLPDESHYIITCMTRSMVFWNWWKLQWHFRDQVFTESYYKLMRLDCVEDIYHDLHDAKTLASSIYPNGVALEESYAIMINELNNEAVLQ